MQVLLCLRAYCMFDVSSTRVPTLHLHYTRTNLMFTLTNTTAAAVIVLTSSLFRFTVKLGLLQQKRNIIRNYLKKNQQYSGLEFPRSRIKTIYGTSGPKQSRNIKTGSAKSYFCNCLLNCQIQIFKNKTIVFLSPTNTKRNYSLKLSHKITIKRLVVYPQIHIILRSKQSTLIYNFCRTTGPKYVKTTV